MAGLLVSIILIREIVTRSVTFTSFLIEIYHCSHFLKPKKESIFNNFFAYVWPIPILSIFIFQESPMSTINQNLKNRSHGIQFSHWLATSLIESGIGIYSIRNFVFTAEKLIAKISLHLLIGVEVQEWKKGIKERR